MKRERTLAISEQYPKVREFLISKSRNSEGTKKAYAFALNHFETFLSNIGYNVQTVLTAIEHKEINLYSMLDNFVGYLMQRQDNNTPLSSQTILLYVTAIRSFLEYWDIDISPNKFKKRVILPAKYKRIKEPLNAEDIRTILLACSNIRLKAFLLVLASSGLRANEATNLRIKDLDFNSIPTKVTVRAETTKTKQARTVYISSEATTELKRFIKHQDPNHLIFSLYKHEVKPIHIYGTLSRHFMRVLNKVDMAKRKEGKGLQRREISFHNMRSFVNTVIATQTNSDFSEYFLGHSYSTYWNMKESERRELYLKCQKYLMFLDYPTVETVGKDFESKLQERDQEIEKLRAKIQRIEEKIPKLITDRVSIDRILKKRYSKIQKND